MDYQRLEDPNEGLLETGYTHSDSLAVSSVPNSANRTNKRRALIGVGVIILVAVGVALAVISTSNTNHDNSSTSGSSNDVDANNAYNKLKSGEATGSVELSSSTLGPKATDAVQSVLDSYEMDALIITKPTVQLMDGSNASVANVQLDDIKHVVITGQCAIFHGQQPCTCTADIHFKDQVPHIALVATPVGQISGSVTTTTAPAGTIPLSKVHNMPADYDQVFVRNLSYTALSHNMTMEGKQIEKGLIFKALYLNKDNVFVKDTIEFAHTANGLVKDAGKQVMDVIGRIKPTITLNMFMRPENSVDSTNEISFFNLTTVISTANKTVNISVFVKITPHGSEVKLFKVAVPVHI